jgi:membrane dipeptidase
MFSKDNLSPPMLIVDGHEDIAWNMITFNRDYRRTVAETRRQERHTTTPQHNGDTLLGWDAYQRGRVAVVFATLFAAPQRRCEEKRWDTQCYEDTLQAYQLYRVQLELYHRLFDEYEDAYRLIQTAAELTEAANDWRSNAETEHPIGLVLLMEGAEAVGDTAELESWWSDGVRVIGPAWAGTRFCGGTLEPGPLTKDGYLLLEGMAEFGFILDISHMDEPAALAALDTYPGRILASHANARSLLKGTDSNRHLSDHVIHDLIEREGVIGIVPMNPFLRAGWERKHGDQRDEVTLQRVANQIDYICQLAGDSLHVGLGSDFDGGFGLQSAPADVDDIADLHKLAPLLELRGYSELDIRAILGENWLMLLGQALPNDIQ